MLPNAEGQIDFGKLEKKLTALFPGSKVELVPLAKKVLIQGQIRNAEEAGQIRSIVRGALVDRSVELVKPIPSVVYHPASSLRQTVAATAGDSPLNDRQQLGRIEHLKQAADHLESAGLKDEAQRIRAQAKLSQQQEQLQRKQKELKKLQEEIRQLRKMTGVQQARVDLKIIESRPSQPRLELLITMSLFLSLAQPRR